MVKIFEKLALKRTLLFKENRVYPLAVLVQNPAKYIIDVLQCILNGFSCYTLLPIQEKGIAIVSYLASKLR